VNSTTSPARCALGSGRPLKIGLISTIRVPPPEGYGGIERVAHCLAEDDGAGTLIGPSANLRHSIEFSSLR